MKLLTSKSGKRILKMTQKEWKEYGREMGYLPPKEKTLTKKASLDKLASNIQYIIEKDPSSLNKLSVEAATSSPVLTELKKAAKKDPSIISKLSDEIILKVIGKQP